MTCVEARDAVLRGHALSAPAQEHLLGCASCRALADELSPILANDADRAPEGELDALFRRVEGAIAEERGLGARLRNLPTRWRTALASVAAASATLALAFLAPRVDLDVYPRERLLFSIAAFTIALASLIVLHLRPLQEPQLAQRTLAVGLAALGLPFAVALLPEAHLAHVVAFHDAHDCLLLGTLCGAALMLVLVALDRGAAGARSLVVPAAAGGVLANLALSFHCPIVGPLHLVVIHAPIGVVLLFFSRGVRSATLRIARARRG